MGPAAPNSTRSSVATESVSSSGRSSARHRTTSGVRRRRGRGAEFRPSASAPEEEPVSPGRRSGRAGGRSGGARPARAVAGAPARESEPQLVARVARSRASRAARAFHEGPRGPRPLPGVIDVKGARRTPAWIAQAARRRRRAAVVRTRGTSCGRSGRPPRTRAQGAPAARTTRRGTGRSPSGGRPTRAFPGAQTAAQSSWTPRDASFGSTGTRRRL